MRFKNGIAATAVIAALFCGMLAHAQNGVKPSNSGKSDPAAGKKPTAPAAPAPAGSDQAKKPVATEKKATSVANPTEAKPAQGKASEPAETADEKSIRASADAFTKLYNAHDSKGLAALFALKAEMIDENDQVVKGREAIELAFAEIFKASPQSSIQVQIESIRVLTPNLAIEEGTTEAQTTPDAPANVTGYVAIHVKADDKWLLGCVRDWPTENAEMTPHEQLLQLGWLVGEWIEESPTSVIHTVCRWHDNDNFLMQEFAVQVQGEIAMSGTMRIGWDAVRKQLKSWVFDSHGGHSEGFWLQNDNEWVLKNQGSTAKGEAASATSVYRLIDADTLGWRSYDRVINGERLEDIEEIIVKRRPPAPAE